MKKFMIAMALTGLVAAPAVAQPGPSAEMRAQAKERFLAFDLNTDGVVSYDELMADAGNKFAEFDQDGNGILILDELPLVMPAPPHAEARRARMQQRMEERRLSRDDMQGAAQGGERPSADAIKERRTPTRMKFMARFDRDHNEQLDVEEFAAPLIKMHKRADTNGDGSVTEAEFDQSLERGSRGKRRHGKRQNHG